MNSQTVQLLFALCLGVYLAPSLVALFRRHPRAPRILVVNVLAGWTLAAWALALWWSLRSDVPAAPRTGVDGDSQRL